MFHKQLFMEYKKLHGFILFVLLHEGKSNLGYRICRFVFGENAAAQDVENAVARTLQDQIITADLARAMPDAQVVNTVEMGQAIIERLGE